MEESTKTEEVKTKEVKTKNTKKSSDNKTSSPKAKGKISTFWDGLKSEFSKIVWPTRETIGKQTLAVTVICIITGALIAVLDFGFEYGLNFLQSL